MKLPRLFLLRGRFWAGFLPWAWLLLFFALPFALIVDVSLSTPRTIGAALCFTAVARP
jgi:putrescine transport system permease protein